MNGTYRDRTSCRRRRVCSVVAPTLAVEFTENGARTVVVDSERKRETNNEEQTVSNDTPRRGESKVSPANSTTANASEPMGLRKHEHPQECPGTTLPVTNEEQLLCMTSNENTRRQRAPGSSMIPCESKNLRQNLLTQRVAEVEEETYKRVARKTQRSMSAHSAALPAPDSSILKDCVTGKIYKRGKLLGKGGFAKVYEGQEVSSGRKFALKIFDKSRLLYPLQRERMEKEIEMHISASKAGHPNVAKFVTMFENPRTLCLVLELCERRSLAQHLRRKGPLSESEVSDLLWQIVCGLSHIHDCGILHRDLKLGNILLSADTVKIADFGLATRESFGKRKTVCGTPNFIAPEVLQRQGHTTKADVWSLGCILYTMLVGRPPFESTSLRDTYKSILKNSYTTPQHLSDEAVDLIRWTLGAKPRNRPSLSDVLNHVFFVKHKTHARFPSIEELTKDFPAEKFSGESSLPQRRRSAVPGHDTRADQSYPTHTVVAAKSRNNSCPADSCPRYSTTGYGAIVRNDPSCSIGPKISILEHMKHVHTMFTPKLTEEKDEEICDDGTTKTLKSTSNDLEDARDENTRNSPQNDDPVRNQDTAKSAQVATKIPNSKRETISGKKAKYSPIKMLASTLQKFRIPSPKSCMKAALRSHEKSKSREQNNININEKGISRNAVLSEKFSRATWVTKWVDYSNKYGFGYQLASGRICVLFNCGAHIALLPDGTTIEYIEPNETAAGCKTVFGMHAPPAGQEYAVKILQFFVTYMDKNLRVGSAASDHECSNTDSARMLTWSRTTDRVAMYLSNGTLQVNFCDDHTKINVSNIHEISLMRVTFASKDGETSSYDRNQFLNSGQSEVRRRLEQAHEEFHHLLEKEHCISHPFCVIFDGGDGLSQKVDLEVDRIRNAVTTSSNSAADTRGKESFIYT